MKKLILLMITLFGVSKLIAQSPAIFKWEDHLSYKSGLSVAEGGGKVYCVTKSGVFVFNKGDNSMDRLSKVNGLSDIEANVVSYNHNVNKAIIAFKDANIDIIDNGTIINIPDIKNKSILGNKAINNIYCLNQFAYLACGFGIVKVDMNLLQISDTYYIGANGGALIVRDITSDSAYFYAATDIGVYKAALNAPNLADYTSWTKMPGLATGIYNTITTFRGKVWTNHSKYLSSNGSTSITYADSVKVFDGTHWGAPPSNVISPAGYTAKELKVYNNNLIIVLLDQVNTHPSDTTLQGLYFGGNTAFFGKGVNVESALMDNNGSMWFADDNFGLVSWRQVGLEYHHPDGPSSASVNSMSLAGGNLMVVPGGISNGYHGLNTPAEIYSYSNNTWNNIKGNYSPVINFDSIQDLMNVLVDTLDPKHAYVSGWEKGVIELYNGVPIKLYGSNNSPLQAFPNIRTTGLALDASSNLWVANSEVQYGVCVKSLTGVWNKIDLYNLYPNGYPDLGQIIVDKNDQKWIASPRSGGLIVLAAGINPTTTAANSKLLSTASSNGALPSQNVYCLAEDKSGEIWVGTDKGITVFYSPENVFVQGQNFDSQQILLTQDGHVQILLLTELVQCIAVDDANRKWIGTAGSGVYLMSSDGTQQIYHFTEANSPLFSNDVRSIAIEHKTGEVFFGTAKGIIEFRGSSTEGNQDYGDMYAFPNPVKPDYTGPIAIKGLVGSTTVKITDVTGTLVYQTVSEGGQALWYGNNFKGQRVSTGVYIVFCTSADGSQKGVTKILFIN